ncbi:integrase arm-type DNA-binding domain-containing protein [Sinirhodobacter sp. HNIBRBA609]|nr:integrase arm-type DNA-binding domain-containing protein [Sinirhodobacter sp. HNIBRBA609]
MPKLTARKVSTINEPGFYGDGEGLYLRVGPTGAKSWILRIVVPLNRKRRDLGLGSFGVVSLAEAREKARALRKYVKEGGDPDALRKREEMTFAMAARIVHRQLAPTWKNQKHTETWLSSIETYANPFFGDRLISTIGTADVLKVLTPIWTEKHETANRLKQRISTVFDWAKGAGHYQYENPVNGLKKALPPIKPSRKAMEALPWQQVPAFVSELGLREGVSARTLEFLILTAVRSGEARGARWQEVDFATNTWTVPPERMKRGVAHRVPLSEQALKVLAAVKGLDQDLIFPSAQRARGDLAKVQSNMVFTSLYRRMQRTEFTTHGFRSSFRDWCSESAHADREVAEASLAHTFGNAVERAYARSDLFERRRDLMAQWGRFVSNSSGDVVRFVSLG